MSLTDRKIAVVVPCYRDEKGLSELYARLKGVLESVTPNWELVLVNDGSPDRTWDSIARLHAADSRVKGINLSRNFGHQIAVTCGLDACDGDAAVVMDSDLQDPPETIPEMARKWLEGHEIVYAVHAEREGDSFFKKFSAGVFYRFLQAMSPIRLPEHAGDFRLLDRKALDTLRRIRERHRYLRGLTAWSGFRQASVRYARTAGLREGSGYTLRKMLRLALDAIASFSVIPLRIATFLGFTLFAVSIFFSLWVVVQKLFFGIAYRGWPSLFIAVSFFSGIQLLSLGIIGEYIGRIYEEVKHRPLYLVQDALGINPSTLPH